MNLPNGTSKDKKSSDETLAGSNVSFESSRDLSGSEFGDYKIIKEIGRGGMAVVYEAFQISLDRRVALKIIPNALINEPQYMERFKREAKGAANLNHPNIVSIHGFGSFENTYYYIMDLVNGKTLDCLLDERKHALIQSAKRFSVKDALEIIKQAASALSYAHSQNIIHRDIKPSNLFIENETKRLLITDFGLAKSERWEKITPRASLFGTPSYMSPEQAQGKTLDARTDVYSLGAVLYEIMTGTEPFKGKNALEVIEKVKTESIYSPSKINPAIPKILENIILRAMSKDIFLRYQNMEDFIKDINNYLSGETISTFKKIAEKKAENPKQADKRKIFFIITIVICTLVIIGIGVFWHLNK